MHVLEAYILGSSIDLARPSHGWTVIELSREHRSVGHSKEPHHTDPCVSRKRPAWEMLGLGPGISRVISTMKPLV